MEAEKLSQLPDKASYLLLKPPVGLRKICLVDLLKTTESVLKGMQKSMMILHLAVRRNLDDLYGSFVWRYLSRYIG